MPRPGRSAAADAGAGDAAEIPAFVKMRSRTGRCGAAMPCNLLDRCLSARFATKASEYSAPQPPGAKVAEPGHLPNREGKHVITRKAGLASAATFLDQKNPIFSRRNVYPSAMNAAVSRLSFP